jgi:hypothetical protein
MCHAAAAASSFSADLSSKLAVAIAPDSWRPSSELGADDFQVATISEVWQKTGYIRVDCQARPGYRLRLVVSCARRAVHVQLVTARRALYMQSGVVHGWWHCYRSRISVSRTALLFAWGFVAHSTGTEVAKSLCLPACLPAVASCVMGVALRRTLTARCWG